MQIQNKKTVIKASLYGILISLIVFVSFYLGLNIELSRLKQQEKLNTTEEFIKYKSNLENLIFSKLILTRGYLAYIKTNPNISQEETTKYLSKLIDPNDKLIRNLSILKDTTIISAYPLNGNEKAIGKNLLDIPEQRDGVLKVKNNLKPIFTGPVNLVQGGSGFISRIPIIMEDGSYWGQLGIVINGDELLKQAGLLEKNTSLKITIFNKLDYPNNPLFGDLGIINENPLIFDMSVEDLDWTIAVTPKNGWVNNTMFFLFWLIIITSISSVIGILVFLLNYTKYNFKTQATIDSLTKVHNRTYLYEYAIPSIIKNRKVNEIIAVLLIDLNDFKMINDIYGHNAGDETLKVTAKRLKVVCNKSDFVVRLGGDEFLVILNLEKIDDLENITNLLYSITSKNFSFEGKELSISVSIGSALYPVDSTDIEDTINVADKRMYEEKQIYKNSYHYK